MFYGGYQGWRASIQAMLPFRQTNNDRPTFIPPRSSRTFFFSFCSFIPVAKCLINFPLVGEIVRAKCTPNPRGKFMDPFQYWQEIVKTFGLISRIMSPFIKGKYLIISMRINPLKFGNYLPRTPNNFVWKIQNQIFMDARVFHAAAIYSLDVAECAFENKYARHRASPVKLVFFRPLPWAQGKMKLRTKDKLKYHV